MKKIPCFLLLLVCGLVAAGCGKGSKIVGTWTPGKPQPGVVAETTFGADGTMTGVLSSQELKGGKIIMIGTYREDGAKFYATMKKIDLQNLPPELKGKEKAIQDQVSHGDMGKEKVDSIAWSGDNSFTLTNEKGEPSTFIRKS